MLLISNMLSCPHSMVLARMLFLVSLIFRKLYQLAKTLSGILQAASKMG